MHDIPRFSVSSMPSSSFNIFLGKRRSGKSVLAEFLIKQMIDADMLDLVFLFSPTSAGFETVIKDTSFRFSSIDSLLDIINNYKMMNEYNKLVPKKKKIKLRTAAIIDDFAVEMKGKNFKILDDLAVRGRHYSYEPLALHFFILSQSLTKIPRVVRLNSDILFFNAIASMRELELILDENFYVVNSSRNGKQEGRRLYESLVQSEDFNFIGIMNFRQNCTKYSDYITVYKADTRELNL